MASPLELCGKKRKTAQSRFERILRLYNKFQPETGDLPSLQIIVSDLNDAFSELDSIHSEYLNLIDSKNDDVDINIEFTYLDHLFIFIFL